MCGESGGEVGRLTSLLLMDKRAGRDFIMHYDSQADGNCSYVRTPQERACGGFSGLVADLGGLGDEAGGEARPPSSGPRRARACRWGAGLCIALWPAAKCTLCGAAN